MHIKDCHSGNSLHADSWVPSHVKSNFIHNSFNYVNKRCSTAETMSVNYEKMHQKLATNGYRKNSMHMNKTTLKSKSIYTSDSKRVVLKLDYINDSTNRKLNKLARKYNLPINLVNKPGRQLRTCFNQRNFLENCVCALCNLLFKPNTCKLTYVVYRFTCKHCGQFYIGSTNRTFGSRYYEHRRSLQLQDSKSALSDHAKKDHRGSRFTIDDFDVRVVRHLCDPVSTRIVESQLINIHKPTINRKHELMNDHPTI